MAKKDKKNKNSNGKEEQENLNNNNKNTKSINQNNNDNRPNSSPTIRDKSPERAVTSKKNLKKLKKEDISSSKRQKHGRLKKKQSSMSMLSFLISEETIRAAKINENKQKHPLNNLDETKIKNEREHLVTISEPDELSSPIESVTDTTGINYKPEAPTSSSAAMKKASKVSTAGSGRILSYLLSTQSFPKIAALVDDKNDHNELLLGYRNLKTNEMKLAIVPQDCFVIYQEDEPNNTFTIVVKEENGFGFPMKDKDDDLRSARSRKSVLKDSLHKEPKVKPFDSKPFAGYINPSWPKKNT